MQSFEIKTNAHSQAVNITSQVEQAVGQSQVREGWCQVFVLHTTAGVAVNEAADPAVMADVLEALDRMVPWQAGYSHLEGNSAAHVKSILVGSDLRLPIKGGSLALGHLAGDFFHGIRWPPQPPLHGGCGLRKVFKVKLDLQEALEQLQYMREEDNEEGVANALFKVAVAYLQRKRPHEAAEPLEEAYYLCRKLENHTGQAEVCLARAQLAGAEKDWAGAERFSREALDIFEGQESTPGVLKALESVAHALEQQGKTPWAAACLEQALLITQEAGDEVGQILILRSLTPMYRAMERWSEALEAYILMGRLADQVGDLQSVAWPWWELATWRRPWSTAPRRPRHLSRPRRFSINWVNSPWEFRCGRRPSGWASNLG